eukprot:CAMPEP_0181309958 /NCGR_PEP_ID=MMETSP1101-20121128/12310_1 /TAXON_ID=46948 /ORGANISM="Rhodomonas abbreviata, Strain Caron Lab Isolate" /LENGTH=491 /DNA_ID=CAMNT_0023416515 /DNA_START=168 /DNA_END=1641 /DNA_ORIENTATION=+
MSTAVNVSQSPLFVLAMGFGIGCSCSLLGVSGTYRWVGGVTAVGAAGAAALFLRPDSITQAEKSAKEGDSNGSAVSNATNAAKLLESVLNENASKMEERDRAAMNFAIRVLLSPDQDSPLQQQDDVVSLMDEGTWSWLATFAQLKTEESNLSQDISSDLSNMFATRLSSAARADDGFDINKVQRNELANTAEMAADKNAVTKLLTGSANWDTFDIVELDRATNNHALYHLALHVLSEHELIDEFQLNTIVLSNWLAVVESSYNDTDYHNATHAADVLQCVHYFLKTAGASKFLTKFQTLGLILAAVVHDLGHDGFTNDFHVKTLSERAMMFNDQSVQENYHLKSFSEKTLADPTVNIFQCLTQEQQLELRKLMIELVLATDMTHHKMKQEDLEMAIDTLGQDPENWKEKTRLFMCAILHACDISNPARPTRLARHWATAVQKEFWMQGDKERHAKKPEFVRGNLDIPTSQIGFIHFVVLPYYEVVHDLLPE